MPPFDRLRAAQSAVEGPERPFGCFAQNTPVPFSAPRPYEIATFSVAYV